MEQEIYFIHEYYDKIVKALDYDIHPKTIVTLPIKIDIYTKLYKFCIEQDNNTDKMYQTYKDLLNNFCIKFDNNNLSIKNIVDFIVKYDTLIKYLYFAFNYLDKHYIKHNELNNLKKELPNSILLENIINNNFNKIKDEIKLIINQIRISSYNHIQELIYQTKLNVFLKLIENKDSNNIYINRLNQEIFISTEYYESIDLDYQNNSAEFILDKLNNIWNSEKKIYLELCPNYLYKIEKNCDIIL